MQGGRLTQTTRVWPVICMGYLAGQVLCRNVHGLAAKLDLQREYNGRPASPLFTTSFDPSEFSRPVQFFQGRLL